MKSRTIEIIDNHIEALEEELEWYQEKNREWQEKCENKQQYIIGGNLDNCFRITTVDELLAENARLRDDLKKSETRNVQLMELKQAAQNEINRLGDQLRWHPVTDSPRIVEYKTISVDVMLKRPRRAIIIAWYRADRNEWWSYDKGEIVVPEDSTWCYIPEGGDA